MVILICLISSAGRFAIDSYLPSIPAIREYFGTSHAASQYTLTLYLFGFGISQLIYGPLSDHYGRRAIMITGLVIFILGCLACVVAASHGMLLVARLVAGIGAGTCGVLNRAIASDCFQGAEFSKAWSYTTTTLVLTLCIAPLFGGIAQEVLGWRANFALSAVCVLMVLGLIIKFLPETLKQPERVSESRFRFNQVLANYYEVLSVPSFIAGTLCYTLSFAGVVAYFQMSPNILIESSGLTPVQYGWCSAMIAFNYLFGGLVVNRYVSSVGVERLLWVGNLLLLAGGGAMLLVYMQHITNIFVIIAAASIYIVGARIIIPNAIAISLKGLRHLGGSCSAMLGCVQMLGSSLVSMLIASLAHPPLFILGVVFLMLGGMNMMVLRWVDQPLVSASSYSG
jgi:Bcr/CflA subfamily drug resistance transporter